MMQADFDAPRLWLGEPASAETGPATRMFRRVIQLDHAPAAATLRLFAESRYHVWVNGAYLARGPILHHGHRLPIATHEVGPLLRQGPNVVAVLVHHFGCPLHNYVPTGKPGLVAELTWSDPAGRRHAITTDAAWRATDRTGWSPDVPRRGWAIGHVEVFDAREHPDGWATPEFDDAGWAAPDVYPTALPEGPGACYFDAPLPPLREQLQRAETVVSFRELDAAEAPPPQVLPTYNHREYADQLMKQPWREPGRVKLVAPGVAPGEAFRIEGLTRDAGAVLNLDLGAEYVGMIVLDCDCPSDGVIDVGWSEYLDGDRPRINQKGTSYVDRVHAKAGRLEWRPIQFTGARYLSLWFRGFDGDVTIRAAGMRATEPALQWDGRFNCSDEALNRVWDLCARTQRVGTQEGLMDCPTREQACYVGDGHPVARWVYQLTGDARHWRYLVREQFARQAANGLIRSTPFSGRDDTLIDYTLLAIIHTREYLRATGDADAVRDLLPACRRVLGWFDRHSDTPGTPGSDGTPGTPGTPDTPGSDGRFAWRWEGPPDTREFEAVYEPGRPKMSVGLNLFIDHPGMGWHNPGEAGIDRRGLNAAINALLVMAREAMADLEEAFGSRGDAAALRASATALRESVGALFFDSGRGVFVDGVLDGEPLRQVSEQTNTWAALAGAWPGGDAAARDAIRRLIQEPDETVARNGPYFWLYLFPLMQRLGLVAEGVDAVRRLWSPMVDRDATTLWETFKGDDSDSACHPWSGAPVEFLLTAVAGLPAVALPGVPGVPGAGGRVELRPRFDLLDRVDARIHTAAGPVAIAWDRDGGGVAVRGSLPEGVSAELVTKTGERHGPLAGEWSIRL